MSVDLRLYALVDPDVNGGHDLAELSRNVAAGGATLVQLRDKTGLDASHDRGGEGDQAGARRLLRAAPDQ